MLEPQAELKLSLCDLSSQWNKMEIWKSMIVGKDADKMPFITEEWMTGVIGSAYRPCMEMGKSENKILLTAGGIIHFTNPRNYLSSYSCVFRLCIGIIALSDRWHFSKVTVLHFSMDAPVMI